MRRWAVNLRNVVFLIYVSGTIIMRPKQLATFTLFLVAVAMALVQATKELIMCFVGSFLRTINLLNSLLLSQVVIKDDYMKAFITHTITIPVTNSIKEL